MTPSPAPLEVHLQSPQDNATFVDPTLTISGTWRSDEPATLSVNGIFVARGAFSALTAWSLPGYSLQAGPNVIAARVTDASGRTAADAINVTLSDLSLELTSPLENALVASRQIAVEGKVNWPGASVIVNGAAAVVQPDGTWRAADVSLPEGAAQIAASASSPGGRSAQVIRNVRVDTIPPGLSVSEPADQSSTRFAAISRRRAIHRVRRAHFHPER